LLTGVYRDVLTRHFSNSRFIEESALKSFIWNGSQATGILIETNTRWRPELTSKRPGIVIKANEFKNMREGIADRRQLQPGNAQGDACFLTFWTGKQRENLTSLINMDTKHYLSHLTTYKHVSGPFIHYN
jgi:hypothetical protein